MHSHFYFLMILSKQGNVCSMQSSDETLLRKLHRLSVVKLLPPPQSTIISSQDHWTMNQ